MDSLISDFTNAISMMLFFSQPNSEEKINLFVDILETLNSHCGINETNYEIISKSIRSFIL